MTTERKWLRPGVRQITTDKWGRWYEWNGDRYWSVTTIIRGGTSNKALQVWTGNTIAQFAVENFRKFSVLMEPDGNGEVDEDGAYEWLRGATDRYTASRGAIGTQLHDYAEAHVLGSPRPAAVGEVADMFKHFQRWLDDWHPTFVMVEAPVFSKSELFAGTLDNVLEVDRRLIPDEALALMTGHDTLDLARVPWQSLGVTGDESVRLLCDYKTGKSVYQDVALQLAAYRHAEFVGLPDGTEQFMPQVDGAAVVHIRPDGYEFVPVATGKEVWESFLYVREVYRWSRDIGKGVLGAAMLPVTQGRLDGWDHLDEQNEQRIQDIENPPEDDSADR